MSCLHCNDYTCTLTEEEFKDVIENFDPNEDLILLDIREDEELEHGFLPTFNEHGVKLTNIRIPILDLIELRLQDIEPYKDSHKIICY